MAVKGAKTKAEMVEKFAKLFGKDWIGEYNGKYYGYHKENGVVHYHQVKWDKENKKMDNCYACCIL